MTTFVPGKETVRDGQARRSLREIERSLNLNSIPIGLTRVPNQQAIPVGGLVLSGYGPTAITSYSGDTIVPLNYNPLVPNYITPSPAVWLYVGCQYEVTICLTSAQQITNASTDAQVYLLDTAGFLAGGNFKAVITTPVVNGYVTGSNSIIITPSATVSDTFAVHAQSAAASLQVQANAIHLIVKRVT
jgi:hypothetical protein